MAPGPHVFGDGRLGVWFMGNTSLNSRLPALKAFAGGAITDIFLPRTATDADRRYVIQSGLFPNLWTTPGNMGPFMYVDATLRDYDRMGKPGAVELNIEKPDDRLNSYVREAVAYLRKTRPNLRLRINIAPFKARFMPADLFVNDPHLFLIEQTYFGNMDGRASEYDALMDMLDAGIPREKASVMYAAASEDPLDNSDPAYRRVVALPALNIRAIRRGSIYQDDLMADAGLI